MKVCVTMDNMIVEDGGEAVRQVFNFEQMGDQVELLEQNAATSQQFSLNVSSDFIIEGII